MTRKRAQPEGKRRNRLVLPALLVLALGLFSVAGWLAFNPVSSARPVPQGDPGANDPAGPNVVIYLIDALRADRLGCYGYDRATSPQLDALADESVLFEQCSAPAPWTLPSVVSLLTSTFACEHRVLVDGQQLGESLEPLAVRLQRIGYATASLHANVYAGKMSGLDRGHDRCEQTRVVNAELVDEWLGTHPDGPLYLYVHNIEPHDPYLIPRQSIDLFGDVPDETRRQVASAYNDYRKLTRVDFSARRPVGLTDNTADQAAALQALDTLKPDIDVLYDASVGLADRRLGRVVERLKQRGLWDNTLFIALSDHGEELGDHGGWQHDQSVWEELTRVPLLIHFPQARHAGRRVGDAVSLVDVMPTILEVVGRPDLAGGCRGVSLVPLAEGRTLPETSGYRVTAVRMNRKKFYRPYKQSRGDDNLVIRRGPDKGIWNVESDTFELYDLSLDPGERTDLAGKYPDETEAMLRFARSWLEECGRGAPEPPAIRLEDLDEKTRENLRALGYID